MNKRVVKNTSKNIGKDINKINRNSREIKKNNSKITKVQNKIWDNFLNEESIVHMLVLSFISSGGNVKDIIKDKCEKNKNNIDITKLLEMSTEDISSINNFFEFIKENIKYEDFVYLVVTWKNMNNNKQIEKAMELCNQDSDYSYLNDKDSTIYISKFLLLLDYLSDKQ